MRDETEGPDEILGAFVERLKAMPASDPRARAAILARVRGRRQSPWRATLAMALQPSIPLLAAATIVVAAIGAGYAGRVLVEPVSPTIASENPTQLIPASNTVGSRLVPKQFVFRAPGANRVAIVGDFNGWNVSANRLEDSTHTGVWEVTLLLPPGRHTYAFLVNDSLWQADPRAPKTVDRDFGRELSAILVADKQ